jgi:antigen 43
MAVTITSSTSAYTFRSAGTTGILVGTRGAVQHSAGIYIPNANDTLINSGTILGGYQGGVYADGGSGGSLHGIVVTNQSTGIIHGYSVGGAYADGVDFYGATGTIVNAGQIIGAGTGTARGVAMSNGGTITNTSTGTISGGGIYAQGAETIVNSGKIFGDQNYGGVRLTAGGIITNLSGGTIAGTGPGYGIYISAGAATVTNAGTISRGSSGAEALEMATGVSNRLIVDPGAVFDGTVYGGTRAQATLELRSGASTGTLSGLGSSFTNFGTLTFDPGAHWLVTGNSVGLNGILVNSLSSGDTIDVTGFTATAHSTLVGGVGVVLTKSGGGVVTLKVAAALAGGFTVTTGAFGTDVTTICFCRGTMIRTPKGQVRVEDLTVGETVVTLGHNNTRKIIWIGKGVVLATRGQRSAATPVIVRKGALADNVPNHDLRITKAHSLYIDGVLIPAEFLVNHKTILWDDRAQEVEIYHVELDQHDVLLANDAPAESYRDDGNRWLFHNANEGWGLPPQEPYAPILTGGPVVDEMWHRLLERAGPRRLPPMTDDPDLHLLVNGKRVDAYERRGSEHAFRLPAHPESVRIVSRETVPTELGLARDPRSLGVALRRATLARGWRLAQIEADDERLADGFHGYEPADTLRWTNGNAALPIELFAGFDKDAVLKLYLGGATMYPDTAAVAAVSEA